LFVGSDGSLSYVDASGVKASALPMDRAAAFRALMDGALDAAYRRAAVLLANRIEAEDAVHDAAERAWRSWGSLRDSAQFDAWFGRILLNVCRDRLRRRRRVALVEVREDATGVVDASSISALRRIDDRSRILDALSGLSADERIAIVLRYEADLTVPAIAALVGAPEGTIKARLHHGLRRLRARLGEEDLG
jgi:RNA polymerase sigma-70 factor (ECF subfamily)